MKINSKECNERLKEFVPKDKLEELAIELLLVRDDDEDGFANMTYKILDAVSDAELDDLQYVIKRIRDEIGIEDD